MFLNVLSEDQTLKTKNNVKCYTILFFKFSLSKFVYLKSDVKEI